MSDINLKVLALRLARVLYTINWLKKYEGKQDIFFAVSLHALWLQPAELRNFLYDEFVLDSDEAFDNEIFDFDEAADGFFGLKPEEADIEIFFGRIVALGEQLTTLVLKVAFSDRPEVGTEQWIEKWGIAYLEDNLRIDRMAIRLGEQDLNRSILGAPPRRRI